MSLIRTQTESILAVEVPPSSVRADWASRLLALPIAAQTALWCSLILVLEAHALLAPPIWDSAMGVFPPAIYLHESGFDIRQLLQEPNWWRGGPNVHSLSLFTWFVAIVLHATRTPGLTFFVVHCTTFLLVAWSLAHYARSLRSLGLDARSAIAAGGLVLLTPLVLVQVGAMYTESWVMAFGILAWSKWQAGRSGTAVAMCILALFVKMTGIAIFVCVGILLSISPLRARSVRIAQLASMLAALFVVRSLAGWLGAVPHAGPRWGDASTLAPIMLERLIAIPDVTLLLCGALCIAALELFHLLAGRGARAFRSGLDARDGARLLCLAMVPVFTLGIVGSIFSETIFLPRYLVPVVPFAVAALSLATIDRIRPARVRWALLAACAVQLSNYGGALYPDRQDGFSILERSHAYRDFHWTQVDLIDAIVAAPRDRPIFVSRDLDYMLSSPLMGYVDERPENVLPIYLPPHPGRSIGEYPEEFLLGFSTASLGGEEIIRLVRSAEADPSIDVRRRTFTRGNRVAALFWIRRDPMADGAPRVDVPPPPASPD